MALLNGNNSTVSQLVKRGVKILEVRVR